MRNAIIEASAAIVNGAACGTTTRRGYVGFIAHPGITCPDAIERRIDRDVRFPRFPDPARPQPARCTIAFPVRLECGQPPATTVAAASSPPSPCGTPSAFSPAPMQPSVPISECALR